MTHDEREEYEEADVPNYAPLEEISSTALAGALRKLPMLGDDMYLRMQAYNVSVVDHLLMQMEQDALQLEFAEDRVPGELLWMLSALTQMWFFSLYELLRTWRSRCWDLIKWGESGGLAQKLKSYAQTDGYTDVGKEIRAEQIKRVIDTPALIEDLRSALDATHITFTRLAHVRMSLAKHEVAGSKGRPARSPGYARLNKWCGSLEYELVRGQITYDVVCRRDIADALRADVLSDPPSKNR